MSPHSDGCPVVGIGASAGGVEALSKFLDHLPPDTGAAYVVLLHSDPSRKSYAVELYGRHTPMNVVEAADEMSLEPNRVYVAPAGARLTLESGKLRIRPSVSERGHSIDSFLVSLAVAKREGAVAVILSGTGSDGTLGVKAVKDHGGLTMAQSEGSAQHFEMPESAIATGVVDVVLPVEELSPRLAQLLRFDAPEVRGRGVIDESDPAIPEILEALRSRTGHDFALYKQGTIGRRIKRRMQLLEIPATQKYLGYLRSHAEEADRLHGELLIGVTRFFRDPSTFESLAEHALGPIVDAKNGDNTVKIWVAGCSTGEEAYSIAILVAEQLERRKIKLNVQIFATDLDPAHLAVARAGVYPAAIEADVSRQRLDRYFVRQPGGYQVSKSVREMLIFSVHNLLRDPPFSKLDLVSCRNVLIYFRSELQKQVLPLFHYALREGGFLFLGPSENVAGFAELFPAVDSKSRLFVRKGGVLPSVPLAALSRPVRMAAAPAATVRTAPSHARSAADIAERLLLDAYTPPAVVVDSNANIVRFIGRTGRYIEPAPGVPEMNVLAMARPGLRTALRKALHDAEQTNQPVTARNVRVDCNGESVCIDLIVRPLGGSASASGSWLVIFQDVAGAGDHSAPAPDHASLRPDAPGSGGQADPIHPAVQHLEAELRHTREDLKASIEDLEFSNEELRSANEEYLSVNEELQSTIEELETSKEEAQSVNEELTTVNTELALKVEQLASANSDIKNLLESTRLPTIFLDADLKIRTFTTAATSIFTLIPADVGRPITDLKLKIDYDGIAADAQEVLRTRAPIMREANSVDGRSYEVRVLPYTTTEGKGAGAVVTFTDVTIHKKADEDARRFAAIARTTSDAVIVISLDGRVLTWNPGAERLYGYTSAEAVGKDMAQLTIPSSDHQQWLAVRDRLCRGEAVEPYEAQRTTRDGHRIDVQINPCAITDESGKVGALAATVHDITDRKRAEANLRTAYAEIGLQFEERGTQLAQAIETVNAELSNRVRVEEALRESKERIKAILNTAAEGIISIKRHGIIDSFNPAAERIFGYTAAEVIGKNVSILMPEPEREKHGGYLTSYLTTGVKKVIGIGREVEGRRKDGSLFPVELAVGEGKDGDGPVFVGILRDLTARKQSENMLRTAERLASIGTLAAGLGHDMNNVLLPVRARLNALRAAAEAGEMRPAERRHTTAIAHSVGYLQQLADGLHYLAMDPDKADAHVSTDLHRWWRQAGALLTKSVAKKIEFTASIPAGLPPVGVAPHQLTQAVLNLLVNASESISSSEFRRRGRIKVSAKANKDASVGPCVKLCVTDNGKGMSDDVRRRAFDMFFTTKPRGMGTGLGLPLVRKVVANAGGNVQIESKEGKGATITMVLPALARHSRAGKARGKGRAALISIADARSVALVQQVLATSGMNVTTGDKPGKHDVWVCEPTSESLKKAESWKTGFPRRRLVLFGEADALSRAKWTKLSPIVIHNRYDFSEVRSALSLAGSGR